MSKADNDDLLAKYGMNRRTLEIRRRFIRLGEEEANILSEKVEWMEQAAPKIVRKFYDRQFSFPSTARFFDQMAKKKGIPMEDLRDHLESAQVGYLNEVFRGSRELWCESYFERRLHVGRVHARIDLPMKWYLGSYVDFYRFLSEQLDEDFPGDPGNAYLLEVVNRVFNYDAQAVCESFLLMVFEQMGMSLARIPNDLDTDKTEGLSNLMNDMHSLINQAQEIADGNLDAEILQQNIPGQLGQSFSAMKDKLITLIRQISQAAEALAAASTELSASSEQMATAVKEITSHTEDAANVSQKTYGEARSAQEVVEKLGVSSSDIGGVLKVIKSITDQTKVLALNATIGAARAGGETGKEFGVVAHEVKELSNATANAAEEISKKIDAIQSDTGRTVGGIREISINIEEISNLSAMISNSIKQQLAATDNTVQAASELSRMAEELKGIVGAFTSRAN